MRSDIAEAFVMTLGVLPRMRALACGWKKPGDRFKSPNDRTWWSSRYAFPLWEGLTTWDSQLRAAQLSTSWTWNGKLAAGDPAELSQSMLGVADELSTITAAGHDVCAPYIIPESFNTLPKPNLICLAKLKGKDEIDKRKDDDAAKKSKKKQDTAFRLLLVVGIGYTILFHYKHGRFPWK